MDSNDTGELARSTHGVAAELRLVQRVPLPPWAFGVLVAAALFGAYLALCLLFGAPIFYDGHGFVHFVVENGRTIILLSVLLGYLTAALSWETSMRQRDMVALGVLEPGGQLVVSSELLRQARWVGGFAALAGLAMVLLLMVDQGGFVGRSVWDRPATPWTLVVLPALFWLLARSSVFILKGLTDMVPATEVDLFALQKLRPIGRIALRGTLFWLVGLSLASVLFFTPGLTVLVLPGFGATAAVAAATLLLPVRGVQRRIRAAKEVELARADALLAGVGEAALRGDPDAQARLAGLVAWRRHVADLPEWPFDGSTLLRFALYLLIPLGSWVAGALVERAVDGLLAN